MFGPQGDVVSTPMLLTFTAMTRCHWKQMHQVGLGKCEAVDQYVAHLAQVKIFLPPMQLIFLSDTEVFLRSLVRNKGLNHKKAKILGYYAGKDRYAVQVEGREKFALINDRRNTGGSSGVGKGTNPGSSITSGGKSHRPLWRKTIESISLHG